MKTLHDTDGLTYGVWRRQCVRGLSWPTFLISFNLKLS
jgi:hypothetical protein